MKQFTSHFDFVPIKKRFKMLHASTPGWVNRALRTGIIIPVLAVLSLTFCTTEVSNDLFITNDNIDGLYFNKLVGYYPNTTEPGKAIRYYSVNGEVLNDTVRAYRQKTDLIYYETIYENGLLTSFSGYDSTGTRYIRYEHLFDDEVRAGYRMFDENNIKRQESLGSVISKGQKTGTLKEWHANGQLKFEMTLDSDQDYQGLMTLYDEQGNILEQELYEDGKLIKKIK